MEASYLQKFKAVFLLFVMPFCVATVQAGEPLARTGRYVFDPGESTIVQTGGFAGVHWTYAIEGQFCLIVDPNASSTRFDQVDANAVDNSDPIRTLDPNEAFNLAGLIGTVVDDTTIEFTGQTADGSNVLLTLTFEDNTARLTGETIPPPNSADFFLFNLDAVAKRKYAGGTGEPNTPYLIATAEQMNAIGTDPNDWDQHFQLTADIDLAQFDGKEGRPAFNIIAPDLDPNDWDFQGIPFTGVFDGGGYTVANFHWSGSDTGYVGLFGYVTDPNAEIRNLGLTDPNIHASKGLCFGTLVGYLEQGTIRNCWVDGGTIVGCECVGGLVGEVHGECEIVDCHATTAVSGGYNTGGLVGWNTGIIANCYTDSSVTGDRSVGGLIGLNNVVRAGRPPTVYPVSSGSIKCCYTAGTVSGNQDVGGVVGGLRAGSIADSYTTASVNGSIAIGGLAGGSNGDVINCYATGVVWGELDAGGLVGIVGWTSPCIVASFWDIETSGQSISAAGTGLTTGQMQRAGRFLEGGWDFADETENGTDDLWWIVEGQDYPHLWWERDEASFQAK